MPTLKRSRIGWTDLSGGDLNFVVRGRTPGDCECSPGCDHCYALAGMQRWGSGPETTTFYPAKLERLLRAKVPAGENRRGPGSRPMAFVCDTGDICHPAITDRQIVHALGVMSLRQDIDWQVLTKRISRLARIAHTYEFQVADNIWVGTTVEAQKQDGRIDDLLAVNAAVRFLSIEPMLGPIDLPWCNWCGGWGRHDCETVGDDTPRIHWAIVGAESGSDRRPFDPAWARAVREQCRAAGVACFLKQDSGLWPGVPLLLDGREVKEWPR